MPSSQPRQAARSARRNAVRIIGGAWRRRLIRFPELPDLRPTPDRVRETLFNWLGQDLSGRRCLDLFAGSGALGFEAASRGASSVALVEPEARAHAALVENAQRLGARAVRIEKADALEFLARSIENFDVVFLDPPFRRGMDAALLGRVRSRLAAGGLVYLESERALPGFGAWEVGGREVGGWEICRQARAGRVHYCLLRAANDAAERDVRKENA